MSEKAETSMVRRVVTAMSLAALVASCTTGDGYSQGPLQPQSVSGPCSVQHFFLLGLRSIPTEMTVSNTGQACTATLVNPALNAVINAALITKPGQHGQAQAGLISGARQAVFSYTPAPGYTGPDTFSVTLEPNAVGITVAVTVTR